jgi:uncharacterized membrane protein
MLAFNTALFKFLLFLHILAVIVAFGPTFIFPLIMGMGRSDPQHMAFAVKVIHAISSKVTRTGAIAAGILGVLLIPVAEISLKDNTWLLIAILIYVILLAYAVIVQAPNSEKMVELTSAATPGEPPSTEIAELAKRLQMGGTVLGVAVLAILLLMVFKPGA